MGGSGIKAVVRAVEAAIASTNVGIEIRDELDAAVAAEIEAAATVATVGAIVKTATSAIAVESVAVDVMSVTAVAISITVRRGRGHVRRRGHERRRVHCRVHAFVPAEKGEKREEQGQKDVFHGARADGTMAGPPALVAVVVITIVTWPLSS